MFIPVALNKVPICFTCIFSIAVFRFVHEDKSIRYVNVHVKDYYRTVRPLPGCHIL